MIHIDRMPTPPEIFFSSEAQRAFDEAKEFYSIPLEKRIQRSWKFNSLIWTDPAVVRTIQEVFHNKCAFCEIPITSKPVIEHFRPMGGAIGLDGSHDPDHYWWLAYQWENLYLICERCSFNKGKKFPVAGKRPKIQFLDFQLYQKPLPGDIYYKELSKERALLVDPCLDHEFPEKMFLFTDDGTLLGTDKQGRGQQTIEIFGLNRDELLRDRTKAINNLRSILDRALGAAELPNIQSNLPVKSSPSGDPYLALHEQLSPEAPYLGAKRQFISRWLQSDPGRYIDPQLREVLGQYYDLTQEVQPYQSYEQNAIKSKYIEQKLKTETEKEHITIGKARYIKRIEIRNFRALKSLELDFPEPRTDYIPWIVLLGENGVGKSSVLKAAAMALMDEQSLHDLNLNTGQILRFGATKGYVKVFVSGYENPFELHFRKGDPFFYKYDPAQDTTPPVEPNKLLMWVFGFGGTRLLPIRDYLAPETGKQAQVQNLFNPFIPLKDAHAWLSSLKGKKGQLTFGHSARAIKTLLQREETDTFRRRSGKVYLKTIHSPRMIPLEDLSDGYQSTIALTIAIMSTTLKSWNTAEDSEGIVLLDEIDVHLHPSWKMEIINDLRSVFPRMQFIITTHDPLCLLGTRPGEVYILNHSPEDNQIRATQVDLPPGITPDQMLTGFWFGLPSVYDDETRGMLQQHRQLLRKLTPDDDPTRLELEKSLRRRLGTFADTSVDRMAQSVAAQVMTEETVPLSADKRMDMRNKLLEMVKQKREAEGGS